MSLAQFIKRTTTGVLKLTEKDLVQTIQSKNNVEQNIDDDFIIAFDPKNRLSIPKCFSLEEESQGQIENMKLRKPLVLRFHKFKESSEPHDFYYSEQLLFYPHTSNDELFPNNLSTCKQKYIERIAEINYVKSIVMPHLKRVEEGQMRAMEIARDEEAIANLLDPEKEQDDEESEVEGNEGPREFVDLDPDEVRSDKLSIQDALYKRIEVDDIDILMEQTRPLDKDQRMVLDSVINYSKQVVKASASKSANPIAPKIIVQGGAGCGKSYVINLSAKWMETIFRTPGDHPDHPYVLRCAFAGTAAANIDGQTLHSAFDFKFGNKFTSLDDKKRDLRRTTLSNLKVLIIDEISMVPVDMLYQLDLRLKEIKERPDLPFGGVAVYLFGDLLQLKPVLAAYPFQEPKNENFKLAHALEPLWSTFDVIKLNKNHRQGDDKTFADMLNRIRMGEETSEDIQTLSSRIRSRNDPTIPEDAIHIFATNDQVNKMNEMCLERLETDEIVVQAEVSHKTMKNFKPFIKNDGSVNGSGLQNILKLKVGAKVMLTQNLKTSDGLTNGAFGEVLGFDFKNDSSLRTIYVHFHNETIGRETRTHFPDLQKLYHGKNTTPIKIYERTFPIGNEYSSTSSTASALQFPLKLSFAVTAHKVQGQTIKKPISVVIDLYKANKDAQAYVMLSRAETLEQLIILDRLYDESWRVSPAALEEVKLMDTKALNMRSDKNYDFNIISLNIRSLKKHHIDLINDPIIPHADFICLQETWLEENENTNLYQIQDFQSSFNSLHRGRGVATFSKQHYAIINVKKENFQISKLSAKDFDLISIYRSQEEKEEIIQELSNIINTERPTLILGDFNLNFLKVCKHSILRYLNDLHFSQLVQNATHRQGGLIDLVFASHHFNISDVIVNQIGVYYSDHDLIHLKLRIQL